MRLGISSYTFNWRCGVDGYPAPAEPATPMRLLETAAACGAGVLQVADNLPLHRLDGCALDALAARSRELDITLETGTRGIRPGALDPYREICRRTGARLLRTLIDAPDHRPDEAEAVALLRAAAPAFERAGVTLAIENHDRFPAARLRRMVDAVASHAVGVCLDTANSLGCGEGVATVLDALAEVTVNLHVKDFTVRRLAHGKGFLVTGAPAGQGLLDIPALLARLRAAGRDVSCILELWSEPEATSEAAIEKEDRWAAESLRYLRPFIGCTSAPAL
jgi:sugar phosphate isomerase/epimerase